MSSSVPVRSTPFPSYLLDAVMPTLRDTEWRLLCVVVRQTLGWQEAAGRSGRKERDWLSHSQLKARTGRSSEAVSRALDTLVRRELVEVGDDSGNALATSASRQRHAGRLYFRLSVAAWGRTEPAVVSVPRAASSEALIEGGERRREENARKTEKASPKSETGVSESKVGKAKTTKETEDKEGEGAQTPDGAAVSVADTAGENSPTSAPRWNERDRDAARFLRLYRDRFRQRSAQGDPPPLSWGRDGALARRLLAAYGYERLSALLAAFFASDDAWAKRCGYSLAAFQHLLPKLLMESGKPPPRHEKAAALVIHGPSAAWQRAAEVEKQGVRSSLFEQCPDLARRIRGQLP